MRRKSKYPESDTIDMARHQLVSKRVAAIHAAAVRAGFAGKRIPRAMIEDRLLVQRLGMSRPNAKVHIDQGRSMGLWELVSCNPKPSALIIQPPPRATHSPPPSPDGRQDETVHDGASRPVGA